jgi:hypothetical protein
VLAFDKIWITRLLSELIKAGVSTHFMHIVQDFHSRRPNQTGVPQGILFEPTLFNFYMNTYHVLKMTGITADRVWDTLILRSAS